MWIFQVGDYVTPRDPKGGGGYENIKVSTADCRDFSVHEKTNYG